jgi:hypothetical protein
MKGAATFPENAPLALVRFVYGCMFLFPRAALALSLVLTADITHSVLSTMIAGYRCHGFV